MEDGGEEEEDSTDSFDSTFRDCRGLWLGVGRGTGHGWGLAFRNPQKTRTRDHGCRGMSQIFYITGM